MVKEGVAVTVIDDRIASVTIRGVDPVVGVPLERMNDACIVVVPVVVNAVTIPLPNTPGELVVTVAIAELAMAQVEYNVTSCVVS